MKHDHQLLQWKKTNVTLYRAKFILRKIKRRDKFKKEESRKLEWIETRKAERGEEGMQIIQTEAKRQKEEKDYKKVWKGNSAQWERGETERQATDHSVHAPNFLLNTCFYD